MQFPFVAKLATLAAFLLPLAVGAPTPDLNLKIRNPHATDIVADSYIIVYNKDVTAAEISSHVETVESSISKRGSHSGIGAKYNFNGFKGYSVHADAATIGAIAASPEVHSPSFATRSKC
jgi:hypothetical protein